MVSRRLRVVQWATGNTGQRALREVIRHPLLELAGVLVYDEAKVGKDAGDLCGEPATGITATADREAIVELEADCVLFMARATGTGVTRAGLSEDQIVAEVAALLASGKNVITTCTDFFARGRRLSEANQQRLQQACNTGNTSVWASGSDPGFMTETLPLAVLSLQRRVDLIEIEEHGDLSRRPSPHMILEQMRFGKPIVEFDPDRRKNHLYWEYQPALSVLADAAGLEIDEWKTTGGVAAAAADTRIEAGMVAAGTAAAQRVIIVGRAKGKEVIRFTQYAYITRDTIPQWPLRPVGWRLAVHGDAPLTLDMPFPVALDDLASYVPAYNANLPVNAVPYVCEAPAGLLTTADLPVILGRGPK